MGVLLLTDMAAAIYCPGAKYFSIEDLLHPLVRRICLHLKEATMRKSMLDIRHFLVAYRPLNLSSGGFRPCEIMSFKLGQIEEAQLTISLH